MYPFTGLPRVVEHFEVSGGVRTGGAQGRGVRTGHQTAAVAAAPHDGGFAHEHAAFLVFLANARKRSSWYCSAMAMLRITQATSEKPSESAIFAKEGYISVYS